MLNIVSRVQIPYKYNFHEGAAFYQVSADCVHLVTYLTQGGLWQRHQAWMNRTFQHSASFRSFNTALSWGSCAKFRRKSWW